MPAATGIQVTVDSVVQVPICRPSGEQIDKPGLVQEPVEEPVELPAAAGFEPAEEGEAALEGAATEGEAATAGAAADIEGAVAGAAAAGDEVSLEAPELSVFEA